MIARGTNVKIADNTGAKRARVFQIVGGSHKKYAQLGGIVIVSIKESEPRKGVKKKEVHYALVVRQRRAYRRKDGSYVRFDDNSVVIVDKDKREPKGTRIFGPIPREIGELGYQGVVSMAPEIV